MEDLLAKRDMPKYRLSVQVGIPHATLNGICLFYPRIYGTNPNTDISTVMTYDYFYIEAAYPLTGAAYHRVFH